jgi:hypothetical protein
MVFYNPGRMGERNLLIRSIRGDMRRVFDKLMGSFRVQLTKGYFKSFEIES